MCSQKWCPSLTALTVQLPYLDRHCLTSNNERLISDHLQSWITHRPTGASFIKGVLPLVSKG